MAAPAQLTKDQVRDLLRSYADAGRTRPNYDQMLRDLGTRVGKPGRHGSIPRLIKLLHEIDEESAARPASLPDPVASQAATLWSSIEVALEAREAQLNAEIERERHSLAVTLSEMEARVRGAEDALTEARREIELRDEVIAGKDEQMQALAMDLAQARQAAADAAAVVDLHAAREADLTLRLNQQAKAAAEREQLLLAAHAEVTEGLRAQLQEAKARATQSREQLSKAFTHADELARVHQASQNAWAAAAERTQIAHAEEMRRMEERLMQADDAFREALQRATQIEARLDVTRAANAQHFEALSTQIETARASQADAIHEMAQLRETIQALTAEVRRPPA